MGFLTPWFLAGIGLLGLPVWLHLLRRHKTTPLPFSSLMFFEKRTQSSMKHRRLEHILLLLLRLAVLTLIILAFAQPFVMKTTPLGAGQKRLHVIAIDNSVSMAYENRLDRAKEQALGILDRIQQGDKAQIFAVNSEVATQAQATDDRNALRAAIQGIQPTASRSSFGEFARAMRALSQTSRSPMDVHLYSDFQKSSLPPGFSELRMEGDTALTLHPLGAEDSGNWAIESIQAPRRLTDTKRARVEATIASFAKTAAERTVTLNANGRSLQSKSVSLAPGGRARVEFTGMDIPYGWIKCDLTISPSDKLPADDKFLFSVERADPRKILFVHGARGQRALLYYQSALEASTQGAYQVEPVPAEQAASMALEKYAFVVLSDTGTLNGAFQSALEKYVSGGGSLFIALGSASAALNRVPVAGQAVDGSRYNSRSGERFQSYGSGDDTHPALRRSNRWEGVKFYQSIAVEPGDSRVVAKLTDGAPALLEKRVGEGRVLVFTSTLDNLANDFPLHPSFVPFVEQTAQYLGGVEDGSMNYTVDSFLDLRQTAGRAASVEVLNPDGKRALSLQDATTAQTIKLDRSGFWEVRRGSGRQDVVAANVDRRESDLTLIPKESLDLWQGKDTADPKSQDPAQSPAKTETETKPSSFWKYVLIAALVAALTESFVAGRYLSREAVA